MENLRKYLKSKAIPEKAINLITSSWRKKTNDNYNLAWRKWEAWCSERNKCPLSSDVSAVLGFLADQFEEGKQYRSLNCYRSALSSTHLPIEGFPVGQHPLVARLLKGVFNCRPPVPRYENTWDVKKVLSFLQSLGSNDAMTLKALTKKLAMLLALVLAHRSSDLVRLFLTGKKCTPNGVTLPVRGLAKQTQPGRERSLQPVVVTSFLPVRCSEAYEEAIAGLRSSSQLFISVVCPHNAVISSTIPRWIKEVLVESGIKEIFKSHSTREASSSAAAMAGISVQEIMSRVGWSRKSTFCKHYYRPQSEESTSDNFSRAILSQATNMQRTC